MTGAEDQPREGEREKRVERQAPGALEPLVARAAAALIALDEAAAALVADPEPPQVVAAAIARGTFRPDEEALLVSWFARLLTVRASLWEVIGELPEVVGRRLERLRPDFVEAATAEVRWRAFMVGYASACVVVRIDRHLLERVAADRLSQRKLNEGAPVLRIPRKQYTAIFRSFTDPELAWSMLAAMEAAERDRARLAGLERCSDSTVAEIARRLAELERALDPSRRRYLERALRYRDHSLRRRVASAGQQVAFAVLEGSGRAVAEIQDRWTPKRVDERARAELAALLQPGDVLVTRHERAFTNLFLPGYWPHAALYVGSAEDRERLSVALDPERAARWGEARRTLEALKDGVRFRALEQTLQVDAVAVIRPRLEAVEIGHAIVRASEHEGKLYNFDFDFFRSDRLVCTEVVYRAYDGLGGIEIPLRERAQRPTLSAEDLLDLALEGRGFVPVAVFGAPGCEHRLVAGEGDTAIALARSYRRDRE